MYIKKGNTITFDITIDYEDAPIDSATITITDPENNVIINGDIIQTILGNNTFKYKYDIAPDAADGWWKAIINVTAADGHTGTEYIKFRVE